ncbi:MAG TPA: glycosyltransferase family A protein [Pyrinomonadaceae bacterium]|nr:glycosyltransferase family A protein [Pyrinomonadaceae bacterium]
MKKSPAAGIGVPVYNGEDFLATALDAILAQDYEDFELIISDNASTDATPEIARRYAARDPRVRYSRNETNIGAVGNFNRVFALSNSKYFMWAGAHDLRHPSMLSRCIAALEADAEVVLAYPRVAGIDREGKPCEMHMVYIDTRGQRPVDRYAAIINKIRSCHMIHGVFRADALRRAGEMPNISWGPDILLLAKLALAGTFALVDETLYYPRRVRPDEAKNFEAWKKRYLETLDPTTVAESRAAALEDLCRASRDAHLEVISESDLSFAEKTRARIKTLRCFERRFGVRLPGFFLRRHLPSAITRRVRGGRAAKPLPSRS